MAACGLAVWEYAWVGGPVWDLVRMDLFRTKSIDPTPNTFFEGYANWPLEPNRSLHELSINLRLANQYLDARRGLMLTYERAINSPDNFDVAFGRIQEMVTSDEPNFT